MQVLARILIMKLNENLHEVQDVNLNKLQKILTLERSMFLQTGDWQGYWLDMPKSWGSSQGQVYFAEAVGAQLTFQHMSTDISHVSWPTWAETYKEDTARDSLKEIC